MRRAGGFLAAAMLVAMAAPALHAQEQTPQPARAIRPKPFTGPYQWTGGSYTYDPAGNIVGVDQQSFRYDVNGRLVSASVLSPDESPSPNYYSSRGYTYDVYGNLTSKTADTVVTPIAVDSTSNHLNGTGAGYDPAGNLTNLTYAGYQHAYSYDALSSLKSETVTNLSGSPTLYHVYSPSDQRLLVADTGANLNTWTIRDLGGNPLRQVENNTSASTWLVRRDYAYRAGVLLEANVVAESRQEHYTIDHLGTPRLITNASAQVVGYHVYLPFGEEWFPPSSSTQEGSPKKFTGHERDRDVSNYAADPFSPDYMHARFYTSAFGRFFSMDPIGGNLESPQTWNRYAYALNNPSNFTDPSGLCTIVYQGVTYVADGCVTVTATADPVPTPSQLNGPTQYQMDVAEWERTNAALDRLRLPDGMKMDRVAMYNEMRRRAYGDEFEMMKYGYKPKDFGIEPTNDEFWLVFGAVGIFKGVAGVGTKFTPNQAALVDLAKWARRLGATPEEAETLLKWAEEYGLKALDHTGPKDAAHWVGGPHIHIGPVSHIPVSP